MLIPATLFVLASLGIAVLILAKRIFTLAWLTVPPIGFAELSKLLSKPSAAAAIHV